MPRPRTTLYGARRRVWPGIPSSSRCTRKNSGARGLTGSTKSGRKAGYSGAPWSRSSTPRSSCRRLCSCAAGWEPAGGGVLAPGLADPRTGCRSAQDLVYTPSSSQAPCALRGSRQNSWWKCRRLYPILRHVGLWSRTWTFQFGVRSPQGFPGQSSTAFGGARYFPAVTAEQIVDTLVPRGDRTLHPASSSSVLPETANQGVFSTFPRGQKVRGRARTRGRNCSPSRARPRRRLSWHRRFFMRASGRTMLVVCRCSFPVVGGNFCARTQKSGGQGKAGTAPSSCVSLRTLLKVFPVHCARAVRTGICALFPLPLRLAVIVLGVWVLLRSTEI